jgi:hypothetical protein
MRREDFRKQHRGPYAFDRWRWKDRLTTKLGDLVVELSIMDDDPTPPDDTMVTIADELASFAKANDEMLLDLIFGHYRYAEKEGWLEFWGVPRGLSRAEILSQVESIALCVQRDREEAIPYDAAVFVNPNWDKEHKLDLRYRKGKIVEVNDEPFVLKRGVLYPKR